MGEDQKSWHLHDMVYVYVYMISLFPRPTPIYPPTQPPTLTTAPTLMSASSSSAPAAATILHSLVQATTNLWALLPPPPEQANPALAADAEKLHALLGAWLTNQPSTMAVVAKTKGRSGPAGPSSVQLLDLPSPTLLHVLSFLVPANPGYTQTHTDKWQDFVALATTCHRLHALSQDDVLWRPVCEQVWGSVTHPGVHALYKTKGWAELYRKLARSTLCMEPGGFRARWQEDYVLQCDVRDVQKQLLLFSQSGPLHWERTPGIEDSEQPWVTLRCAFDPTGQQTSGCAAWLSAVEAMDENQQGMLAATLYRDHPALRMTAVHAASLAGRVTPLGRYTSYWRAATERGDVRVEVRVCHVPSGRTSLLFSSRQYYRGMDEGLTLGPANLDDHPDYVTGAVYFQPRWLSAASPFQQLQVYLPAVMDPASAVVPSELSNTEKVGIGGFRVALGCGVDNGLGQKTMELLNDVGFSRGIYQTLQSLAWTD